MKYFLLNKEEVKQDIFKNPELVKTKSWGKIKKYQTLKKKLDYLYKQIETDLKNCNSMSYSTTEIIDKLLHDKNITEITSKDYNALYGLPLYDDEVTRIKLCNRSEVLKGKLWGNEIK
jgi:hypothetical protein